MKHLHCRSQVEKNLKTDFKVVCMFKEDNIVFARGYSNYKWMKGVIVSRIKVSDIT